MATILYARVSTVDQTLEHQRSQAEKARFRLYEVVSDLGVNALAKATGLSRQTIYRIKNAPVKQLAALQAWYPISQPSSASDRGAGQC